MNWNAEKNWPYIPGRLGVLWGIYLVTPAMLSGRIKNSPCIFSVVLFVYMFAKLHKATISFIMLSVHLHRTAQLPLDRYSWNLIFESIFWKSVEKIQVSLKSDWNNGYCIWRPRYMYDNISPISSWNEKYFR